MTDIYWYAKKMEKDGEAYYRELAVGTKSVGVRKIFEMLADEEVKHFNLFSQMENHDRVVFTESPFLDNVRNVFEKIREEKSFGDLDASQSGLYRKAQDLEEESEKFYREKAEQVDAKQRSILLRIAAQERRHYRILEDIVQMVARPQHWLENAEFYHGEEY